MIGWVPNWRGSWPPPGWTASPHWWWSTAAIPAVADQAGVIRDEHCPPVEMNTTALVSTPAARAVAQASQRYVYGDFRMVDCSAGATRGESTAQLAAEIVLRTSTW